MYTNKCIKCGKEFETKNPKRVICPDCLYPDKQISSAPSPIEPMAQPGANEYPRSYSVGSDVDTQAPRYNTNNRRNYNNYNSNYNRDNYNNVNNGESYNHYQQRDNQRRTYSNYNNQRPRFDQRRPYNNNQRPRQGQGNLNRNNNAQGFNRRRALQKPKALLVNREQLMKIEDLYKKMLPLPNPDAHEVIAQEIGLEPKKVFFGINLVRQKLMLPKIQMPKRKLALTPDQLMAIKNLYEPLLPLPPIGCHKILAAQLKIDEWRVHVGIGLVRKQMGLDRWNQTREDAPEEYRQKA